MNDLVIEEIGVKVQSLKESRPFDLMTFGLEGRHHSISSISKSPNHTFPDAAEGMPWEALARRAARYPGTLLLLPHYLYRLACGLERPAPERQGPTRHPEKESRY